MRRQICTIALLLMGAALAGVIVRLATSHAPKSISISADKKQFQPEQESPVPPDFSKVAQSDQTLTRPKPQVPPIDSNSTGTVANDHPPVVTNAPTLTADREFYKIAETNQALAVELAAELDPSQRTNGLMENLIQRWADADLLAAAAWVELQPAGDEHERLQQQIGFVLSQVAPADAAEFVVTHMPSGPGQDEAIMTVVNQWGNQNLAAAAAWVKHFPEGSLQERAVNELEGIARYHEELSGISR